MMWPCDKRTTGTRNNATAATGLLEKKFWFGASWSTLPRMVSRICSLFLEDVCKNQPPADWGGNQFLVRLGECSHPAKKKNTKTLCQNDWILTAKQQKNPSKALCVWFDVTVPSFQQKRTICMKHGFRMHKQIYSGYIHLLNAENYAKLDQSWTLYRVALGVDLEKNLFVHQSVLLHSQEQLSFERCLKLSNMWEMWI